MATKLVGWELLYALIEANLKSESDVIIAITHWFLIKEGGFRCLSTGDNVRLMRIHFNAIEKLISHFPFVCSVHLPKMNRVRNYCRPIGMQIIQCIRCDTFTMGNCTFYLEMSQPTQ